jgi:hypothetical protein
VTPKQQLTELLTCTQRNWRKVMDGPDLPREERMHTMAHACSYFSSAWLLRALIQADEEAAREAVRRLDGILNDGGAVGEWTWDLLQELGIDPASLATEANK